MEKRILYPPNINWTLLYQRPQFILRELAKNGWDCYFMDSNPPYEGAEPCYEPYSPEKGITVVPPNFNPRELGDFSLYYSNPVHYHWDKLYKPELTIFDYLDYPVGEEQKRDIHHALSRNTDLVLTVSKALYNECKGMNRLYIPNGVEYDLYNGINPKTKIPYYSCLNCPEPIMEAIDEGKKIIGYSGVFWKETTDWPLFLKIAKRFPDDLFVVTGSFFKDYGEHPDNMLFLGHVDREILPAVMGGFHVGVIPFLENRFTKAMCPLKAFEYLASGLPIVSTPIPEVEKLRHRYIASRGLFVEAIETALLDWSPETVVDRVEEAETYDWKYVLEPLINKIEGMI